MTRCIPFPTRVCTFPADRFRSKGSIVLMPQSPAISSCIRKPRALKYSEGTANFHSGRISPEVDSVADGELSEKTDPCRREHGQSDPEPGPVPMLWSQSNRSFPPSDMRSANVLQAFRKRDIPPGGNSARNKSSRGIESISWLEKRQPCTAANRWYSLTRSE